MACTSIAVRITFTATLLNLTSAINHRQKLGFDDAMRTEELLKGIGGKRLTYRRTDAEA